MKTNNEHNLTHLLDTRYDDKFREISGLKWLPWIGKNYLISNFKILLIGDTHYGNTKESIDIHDSEMFTREIIEEMPINRWYYNVKFYQNLHLALFGNDVFKTQNFWINISFYNFIQTTMQGHDQVPSNKNFKDGWNSFYKVIDIIKPTVCIFLGVRSLNNYHTNVHGKYDAYNHVNHKKINNAIPRNFVLSDGKHDIKVIGIKHPSKYFSWIVWNNYLNSTLPNEITWLKHKLDN